MTLSIMKKHDRKNLLFFDIDPKIGKNSTTFGAGSF